MVGYKTTIWLVWLTAILFLAVGGSDTKGDFTFGDPVRIDTAEPFLSDPATPCELLFLGRPGDVPHLEPRWGTGQLGHLGLQAGLAS